jgi:hypothetical protein
MFFKIPHAFFVKLLDFLYLWIKVALIMVKFL